MRFSDGCHVSDAIAAAECKRRVIHYAAWVEPDVPELVDIARTPDVDIQMHRLAAAHRSPS